ncbi:MAG: hypothetical protein AAGI10_02690 [Pseudomonadota bacterium]
MDRSSVEPKDAREAVSGLSALTEASHDSLAGFSDDLKVGDAQPDFWSGTTPVWIGAVRADKTQSHWPILERKHKTCTLRGMGHGGALIVREADLINRLQLSAPETLTAAEMRIAIDLAQGLTLNDSAESAGLSAATRRKQVQNLFRKLDISSQTELVLFVTDTVNQFVFDLTADEPGLDGQSNRPNSTIAKYQKHLPEGARWGALHAPNGGSVNYVDIGPVDGKPVLILHSMVFPNIDAEDVALFHELGWRTLWPLRPGALAPASHRHRNWHSHCDQVVADIRVLLDSVTQNPVPFVSLVSGGSYATSFAETYPNRVQRIDLVATCFTSGKGGDDNYFFDQIVRKMTQNGRLAAVAAAHLVRGFGSDAQLEKSTRRIYRDSNEDQTLLDDEFGTPERRERFSMASMQSLDSMRMDYLSQMHFSWDRARDVPHPVRFWHGTEDRVNNLEQVTRLSNRVAKRPPHAMRDLGHLTQGPPIRAAFRAIDESFGTDDK